MTREADGLLRTSSAVKATRMSRMSKATTPSNARNLFGPPKAPRTSRTSQAVNTTPQTKGKPINSWRAMAEPITFIEVACEERSRSVC